VGAHNGYQVINPLLPETHIYDQVSYLYVGMRSGITDVNLADERPNEYERVL
jgi:hypothetical protein